ncbi:hypothetical protein K439DRAFT_1624910 [Ramaria rubella]|nr:hypothetical protein K439DRAFT_1624910 [Ramaria rubella]
MPGSPSPISSSNQPPTSTHRPVTDLSISSSVSHLKTILPDSHSHMKLPKSVVVNPFASTLHTPPGVALPATQLTFLPEPKPKMKKSDDQVPHRINKTSNRPKNLFTIDYIGKHPGTSKTAITQAYTALVPEHKQPISLTFTIYVTLGSNNNVNKCQSDLAGTTTLD